MGKSRKKTPVIATTTAESEKAFKQQEHQRERSRVRDALNADRAIEDIDTPPRKLFGNPWAGDKDGKRWLREPDERLLRK